MEKNICYFDAAKENSEAGLNPISIFFFNTSCYSISSALLLLFPVHLPLDDKLAVDCLSFTVI